MFDDYKELLSVFNAHNVKYLVVGGHAVSFHAQPRATKDLDLFIQADPVNAKATYDALKAFGAPLSGISIEDFRIPEDLFDLGGSQWRSTFCLELMESSSTQPGRGG